MRGLADPSLFRALTAEGMILGVAASDDYAPCIRCLEELGIAEFFPLILSADRIPRPKPFPDGAEIFLETFSLRPEEVWVVGDSENDMRFAANSGLAGIYLSEEEKDLPEGAVCHIEHLSDLLGLLSREKGEIMEEKTWRRDPVLKELEAGRECLWINPDRLPFAEAKKKLPLGRSDIEEASLRLARFAPLIAALFPETEEAGGIIESPLTPIPRMKQRLLARGTDFSGELFLKRDSDLPIAGSVKARGGIYEVLKHTEDLALAEGFLKKEDASGAGNPSAYLALAGEQARAFFARHSVQVGSTGNLGMSIGIMSAALGYRAIVHMSADAKQWKKDLLRSRGVTVVEYASDYSEAVKKGREASKQDPTSYFVDDENSRDLFLGYAVAALRLRGQLEAAGIPADPDHPLFVYLPCGVGGAPGGITFGLKQVFGDAVHCFFVEPVQAPGMLAGMASGLQNQICVQDLGLTGKTEADGLAVGRPSGFVGGVMATVLDGACTVRDERLFCYLRDLYDTEKIFLEPSACAGFRGLSLFAGEPAMTAYLKDAVPAQAMDHAAHLVWATGGRLVPEAVRRTYLSIDGQEEAKK